MNHIRNQVAQIQQQAPAVPPQLMSQVPLGIHAVAQLQQRVHATERQLQPNNACRRQPQANNISPLQQAPAVPQLMSQVPLGMHALAQLQQRVHATERQLQPNNACQGQPQANIPPLPSFDPRFAGAPANPWQNHLPQLLPPQPVPPQHIPAAQYRQPRWGTVGALARVPDEPRAAWMPGHVLKHYLGWMNQKCEHCNALHWLDERITYKGSKQNPKFGLSCNHGKVQLPPPSDPPIDLLDHFTDPGPVGKEFRDHIRQYNAAFAFTSLGCKLLPDNARSGAPYAFQISGELHHQHGALLPLEDEAPVYAQLYFFDPDIALQHRMGNPANVSLNRNTTQFLQEMLQRCNPFINIYKTAKDLLQQNLNISEMAVRIHFDASKDQRHYNAPTASEIATILPGQADQQHDGCDIIVHLQGGSLQRISHGSPVHIPLHYTLLYPNGDPGWHWDMQLANPSNRRGQGGGSDEDEEEDGKHLTCARYHAYRIHWRESQNGLLLRGGKLFQQYIVDAWAQVEQSHLQWFKYNQKTLRAEVYSGLTDALASGEDLEQIGK
ncbi:hypothetical protein M422DRAFT_248636 [Sphaerobolus stellatus SS14]|nr:hypothetical protein M422DRAFT_248636 [Sphaerobolus stellatus SS14]